MAIRTGAARLLVLAMQQGMPPEAACRAALEDVGQLRGGLIAELVLHAVDRRGNFFVASTGVKDGYSWWSEGQDEPRALEPVVL